MTQPKYRTAFFGTPEFAKQALGAIIEHPLFEVVCVVTQPDRPAGRGQTITPSPVKILAEKHAIPVFEPHSLKSISVISRSQDASVEKPILTGEKTSLPLVDFLNSILPLDILVTAAYGNIIPVALLNFAKQPMVNVHPSLLPRWRGAAPLQWAIFSGDKDTGVCLMKVEQGLDTGGVYCQLRTPVDDYETLGELHDRLARIGAELLTNNLEALALGQLLPKPQDDTQATYAHKWEKSDATILWQESALQVSRRIRASNPSPGARTFLNGSMLKIFSAEVLSDDGYDYLTPGTLVAIERDRVVVVCGEKTFLAIKEVQLPGKNRLTVADLLRGHSLEVGSVFQEML